MTGSKIYFDRDDPTDDNSRAVEERSEAWVDDPQLNTTSIPIHDYNAVFDDIEKRMLLRRSMILNLMPQAGSSRNITIKPAPQIDQIELESPTPIRNTLDDYEERKTKFLQKKRDLNTKLNEINHSDFESKTEEAPHDLYSFIMVQPFSLGSLVSILLFMLQITVYILSISDAFDIDEDADVKQKTLLTVPRGVSLSIIVAQFIAIFLGVLVQDSLFTAISLLHKGFERKADASPSKKDWRSWLLSNFMRLLENLVGTVIIFVLIVKSENVITLLKDFTTMTFISQLDDNIFKMAETNFLGQQLKNLTELVKKTEYYPSKRKKYFHFQKCPNRAIYFLVVLFPLYFMWAYYFLFPQIRHELVCQRIFIQIDDQYRTNLGYFTGYYRLDSTFRHAAITNPGFFSPAYVEDYDEQIGLGQGGKPLDEWGPLVLRYCGGQMFWIIGKKETNYEDECNIDKILVKSVPALDDQSYDVFALPEGGWLARSEDGRLVPVNVFMSCQDEVNNETIFTETDKCDEIELFDDTDLLKTSRVWAHKYKVLRNDDGNDIRVYNRPVYINDTLPGEFDLVLFTGLRWKVLSTSYLKDFTSFNESNTNKTTGRGKLIEYLDQEFHGHRSNYEIAFFSEPVIANSPKDKLTPVELLLLRPNNKQKIQLGDYDEKVKNKFICSKCKDNCLYNGTCTSGKCICKNGSSGTLCQKEPTGDGYCNDYFNEFQYNFDGGDCCASTCVSSKQYCGRDETNSFFVGFDKCKNNEDDRLGSFIKAKAPLSLAGQPVDMSLSGNGNILAICESESRIVSVFDSEGSRWIKRDGSIRNLSDNEFGKIIRVSGADRIMKHKDLVEFVSITTAVLGTSKLYIYDWAQTSQSWKHHIIEIQGSARVSTFEIRNEGKLLILLKDDGQIMSFKRQMKHEEFKLKSESPILKFDFISVSNDGNIFLGANRTCVHFFTNLAFEDHQECFFENDFEIKNIQISPTGNAFGYVALYRRKPEITIFKRRNKEWVKSRQLLMENDLEIMTISDDGKVTYRKILKSLPGYLKSYISSDQKHMIIFDSIQSNLQSTIKTFKVEDSCGNDTKVYFTFALDYSPNDLSWQIIQFNGNKTKELHAGGPYESTITAIHEACVPTTECIGVKIIDFGMDGLNGPGYLGIATNGTVKWNLNSTNGYSNLYYIFGGDRCDATMKEVIPWKKYDTSLHKDCLTFPCHWVKIGRSIDRLFYNQESQQGIHSPISMSADGFILAIGHFSYDNVGQVNLYKFDRNQGDWVSLDRPLVGNNVGGMFGFSVDLSADGSIVFIGSYSNVDKGLNGLINSFAYDKESLTWYPDGEIIFQLAENSTRGRLFDFSTSANGNKIAVAAPFSVGNNACVYYRNTEVNQFQKKSCLYSDKSNIERDQMKFTDIKLSARGLIVAVSFMDGNNVLSESLIEVFTIDDDWQKQGHAIKGFGRRYDEVLISLSPDGSALAITNGRMKKIQVYKFTKEENLWQKKGEYFEITSISDTPDVNTALIPKLSADGSILLVSCNSKIYAYHYDQRSNLWIEKRLTTPQSYNEGDIWLPMGASADISTVAVGSNSSVNVFRLNQTSCGYNEDVIDFRINPDDFPQDFVWRMFLDDGTIVSSGHLVKETEVNFKYCLDLSHYIYIYLQIEDTFGDGLCCTWGDGSLDIKWNNDVVFNGTDFKTEKILVLPPSLNMQVVEVYINNSNSTGLSYAILNNKDVFLDSSLIAPGTIFQKSFELPDLECLTFIIYDESNSGNAFYSFLWNGEGPSNRTKERFMEKYRIGKCAEECLEGTDLLEINLLTNANPKEIVWDILSFDNKEIFSFNSYTNANEYNYHSECVPQNDCYVLEVITDGDLYYDVALANKTVFSGPQQTFRTKTEFGYCPQLNCSEGLTLLEFDFEVDIRPEEFSWQLTSSNGTILLKSGKYMTPYDHFHIYYCIPVENCTTLELKDNGGNGGTSYSVSWDNEFKFDQGNETYNEKIIELFC